MCVYVCICVFGRVSFPVLCFVSQTDDGGSSTARQAVADAAPVPHTAADLLHLLGDTSHPVNPVYGPSTLVTVLLDAHTGNVTVWADSNPKNTDPVYQWNMFDPAFWQ